jgi:DNA-binding NtrC family response regulator
VLVIEPDPYARGAIAAGLELHGAMVASADTVANAARLLDEFQADLLLGDGAFAAADGYALLELLHARGRRIPAIARTPGARPDDGAGSASAGYWRQLGKPVDIAELVATVSTVAGLSPRRGEP